MRRWGKIGGCELRRKGGGGEERAARGSSKRQGTMEAEEIKGIN